MAVTCVFNAVAGSGWGRGSGPVGCRRATRVPTREPTGSPSGHSGAHRDAPYECARVEVPGENDGSRPGAAMLRPLLVGWAGIGHRDDDHPQPAVPPRSSRERSSLVVVLLSGSLEAAGSGRRGAGTPAGPPCVPAPCFAVPCFVVLCFVVPGSLACCASWC